MNHNITDLGIPAESELRGIGINADFLAEVCIAMRFAWLEPNQDWESWVEAELADYAVSVGAAAQRTDDYHEYLICNWLMKLAEKEIFHNKTDRTGMSFHRAMRSVSALRGMSHRIFQMDEKRRTEWDKMRGQISIDLSEEAHHILEITKKVFINLKNFLVILPRSDPKSLGQLNLS